MKQPTLSVYDYPALLLLAATFLNLTGVVTNFVTPLSNWSSLMFYVLAAPVSFYLLLRFAGIERFGGVFASFVVFIAVYLIASIWYSVSVGALTPLALKVATVYVFQGALIASIYFWASRLDNYAFDECLRLVKHCLLASCLAIILAPLFISKETERISGLFPDQNLAAFGALFCLALIVAHPPHGILFAVCQIIIALMALFLTFSRTGLLTLLALCGLYILRRPGKLALASAVGFASFILITFLSVEYDLLNLSLEQARRLNDVADIVAGNEPQTRYEYRDILYEMGMERIYQYFPFGGGIGSLHSMEYGIRHRSSGEWLGVHNSYLMIVGEAGLAGLVAFTFFSISLVAGILLPSPRRLFCVGSTVVIACSMLTTHSVLNDKIAAVILALVMASVDHRPGERTYHDAGA